MFTVNSAPSIVRHTPPLPDFSCFSDDTPILQSSPQKKAPGSPSLWTPEKSYSFTKTKKKIHILWTPTASKKFRKIPVVYQIKNRISLKKYVGQSVDLFKRISSHISKAKRNPHSELQRDMAAHPEHFELGAIVTKSPDRLESQLIARKNTIFSGYNRRNGGGGGTAREKIVTPPEVFQKALKQFEKTYGSPLSFSLTKSKSRITALLPSSTLNQKNVIYRIQRKTATGVHVYVGCTERKFANRLREHLFFANHTHQKRYKASKLYKALHKNYQQFTFAIINTKLFPKELPIGAREQVVIQFYQNRGYTLYNCNRGGGGGAAKK